MENKIEMVGPALATVFHGAKAQHRELNQAWIKISYKVGGRLPASLLVAAIQRDGEVDLVLRSIEDEMARRDTAAHQQDVLFTSHYFGLMSNYWIGSINEIFRLLRQRELADDDQRFTDILTNLELVRMPLEKHEIAKDQKLKEPLTFVRNPSRNDPSDIYVYDPKDNTRAHIMPQGLMPSGSWAWQAVDVRGNSVRWVERRSISDKIIELWG
jgi:hypothetical protein